MTDFTANHAHGGPFRILFAPFRALFDLLVYLGESSARAQTLKHIARLSDADLDKMGTTRADLIRRTVSDWDHM